jgi:preprotein translocase subunit SecA
MVELVATVVQMLGDAGLEGDESGVKAALSGVHLGNEPGPEVLEPVLRALARRWPAFDQMPAWAFDERLIGEAVRTRLWSEFHEDPRSFVKAVALEEVPRQLERRLMLEAIDTNWCNHLEAMDYLREGINLRGYAQTDPFIAYRKEGRTMFENMLGRIAETVVMGLFETTDEELVNMHSHGRLALRIAVDFQNVRETAAKTEDLTAAQSRGPQPASAPRSGGSRPSSGGGGSRRGATAAEEPAKKTVVVGNKVGRNDPCPCGSGKKYKLCCGRGQ